jgi:hypothetical protein
VRYHLEWPDLERAEHNNSRGRHVDPSPSSPLSSSHQAIPVTADICSDTEVDDEALVQQYDVGDGIGHEIFGSVDSGGLEEIGNDEDGCPEDSEDQRLSSDGEHNLFLDPEF